MKNLNNTTPGPPSGNINITWQADSSGNVSGYVPAGTFVPAGDLSGTLASQTVIGLEGKPLDATTVGAPSNGQVITYNSASGKYVAATPGSGFTAGGDLSGTGTSQTVIGLEGKPLDATTVSAPTDGQVITYSAASGKYLAATPSGGVAATRSIGITIDGGGSPPTTGSKGYIQVPYNGTITSWTILANASGSAQVTVKKSTYAGFPTTSSIVASAPPNISSAQNNTSSTLTGWTTAISAGDVLEFNLDSVATCTRLTLELTVQPAGTVTGVNFADNETVSGSGTSWTLAHTPNPSTSLQLYQYLSGFGQVLLQAGTDYTLSGSTITTTNSLATGALRAWYRY